MDVDPTWEANAREWARFARSPEHDHFFWTFNGPRFLELIPRPGRCTLDLACGEGRLGRLLRERGHRVIAVDVSPAMARMAHEAGGQLVVVGNASHLPIASGTVEIATAFMSLQDIADLETAVAEVARVLVEGGSIWARRWAPPTPQCRSPGSASTAKPSRATSPSIARQAHRGD